MILAFEGAPGVGKSTLAAALAATGAYVIPEVNLLFARPSPVPMDWYIERQTARWEMAVLRSAGGGLVVLDGDPFQPIWFNWIMGHDDGASWRAAWQTYHTLLKAGRMAFPTRYVIAHIDHAIRNQRLLDRERARGLGEARALQKVERYRSFADYQLRYWQALALQFPGWVMFVETTDVAHNIATVRDLTAQPDATAPAPLEVSAFIEAWLTDAGVAKPAVQR